MTKQEKIKWLAENIFESQMNKWNPFKYWDDCGMLIDKVNEKGLSIEIWNNHYNPETKVNDWRCRISLIDKSTGFNRYFTNVYHKNFCECVTEAIFKAFRWDIWYNQYQELKK